MPTPDAKTFSRPCPLRNSACLRQVRPLGGDDYEEWDELLVSSYGDPGAPMPDWRQEESREAALNYSYGRRVDGRLAATAIVWPLMSYHGERVIPATIISAVATHPEHRRRGLAAAMFRELLEAIREAGYPLSILYPFSYGFYRKLGWQHVADFVSYEIPLAALPSAPAAPATAAAAGRTRIVAKGRPRERVEIEKADVALLNDVYRRYARSYSGMVERDDGWWRRRVLRAGKELSYTALWEDGEGRTGAYVVSSDGSAGTYPKDVTARGIAAASDEARRGLLAFLKGYEAQFLNLKVNLPVSDPLAFCLDNPRIERKLRPRHMLRLVDVPAALEAMAEPEPGFESGVVLSVRDPVCPWNDGDWLVEVRGGKVAVRRAPSSSANLETPGVELTVATLAQIVAGFLTPETAKDVGKLSVVAPEAAAAGEPDGPAVLGRLFGRRSAYLFDAF